MSSVTIRYDVSGLSSEGGDPVAFVSITPPMFQAGQSVVDAFIEVIRDFFAVQQNVTTVIVARAETVTTNI